MPSVILFFLFLPLAHLLPTFLKCLQLFDSFFYHWPILYQLSRNVFNYFIHLFYHWPILLLTFQRYLQLFHTFCFITGPVSCLLSEMSSVISYICFTTGPFPCLLSRNVFNYLTLLQPFFPYFPEMS